MFFQNCACTFCTSTTSGCVRHTCMHTHAQGKSDALIRSVIIKQRGWDNQNEKGCFFVWFFFCFFFAAGKRKKRKRKKEPSSRKHASELATAKCEQKGLDWTANLHSSPTLIRHKWLSCPCFLSYTADHFFPASMEAGVLDAWLIFIAPMHWDFQTLLNLFARCLFPLWRKKNGDPCDINFNREVK